MLEDLVGRATAQPRFTMSVVGGFSLVALLVAAVGIYGTLSYVVAARTREIGIRLALGAERGDVSRSLLIRGLAPALTGGALGLGAAIALARVFSSMLFQTAPLDAASLAGAAALLLVTALVASAAPALRAARVDPAVALRTD
jgi:putative ABC transport system permease protein